MIALCSHASHKKNGKDKRGVQRYICLDCKTTFAKEAPKPLGDMRTSMKDAVACLGMLLEGLSMRAVCRLTGMNRHTLDNLILTVGDNCQAMMDNLRGVPVENVSADELWSFIALRERERDMRGHSAEHGDSWCWLAVESNHKMIVAHHVGKREGEDCWQFINRLNNATVGRFQLSTDGLAAYRTAVAFILRDRVAFGQMIKNFSNTQAVIRYAPGKIISVERKARFGNPDVNKISTSHSETLNQKLRQHLRRFSRLSAAHSKALRQHKAMLAIWICFYNWCRRHETIKSTPAMAANIADHQWTLAELLERAATV